MSKKLRLLLAAIFMFVAGFAQTSEVSIGQAGTPTSYAPTYTYYNYSLTEMIYLKSEIGQNGLISSVSFKASGATRTRTLEVYLAENSISSFSSYSDALPESEFTLVYSGSVTFTNGSWAKINFDEEFLYQGTGNLVIAVRDLTGSYQSAAPSFTATSVSPSRAVYTYWDDQPFTFDDLINGESYSAGTTALPDIKMEITTLPANYCPPIKKLAVSSITSSSATFSWTAGGEETKWRLQITTADDENWANTIASTQVTSTSYTRTGLNPQTSYKARVQAMCAASDASWKTISFQTPCVAIEETSLPYNYGFENAADFTCWSVIAGNAEIAQEDVTLGYYYPAANSGSKYLKLYGNNDIVVLPSINADLKNIRFRFAAEPNSYYEGDLGKFEVGLISNKDISTFKSIKTINLTEGDPYKTIDWVTFANETGTAAEKNIAIKLAAGSYGGSFNILYIDDVEIELLPDCPVAPEKLAVTDESVTDEGAKVTFEDAEGTDWELFYKADNDEDYTKVALTTTSYTFTNLAAATHYTAYVSRKCTTGKGRAEKSNVVEFTTKYNCAKITGTLSVVDTMIDVTTAKLKFKDNTKVNNAWTVYYKTADAEEYSSVEVTSDNVVITGEGDKADTTIYADLTDLTKLTSYTAYVTLKCNGIGEPSNTINFSTKQIAIDLVTRTKTTEDKVEQRTFFVDFDESLPLEDDMRLDTANTNKWVIGEATGNTGKSLYISSDNGESNTYNIYAESDAYAVFRVKFPADASVFNISFDYKAKGENSYDYLRVYLQDDNTSYKETYGATMLVDGYSSYNWKNDWTQFAKVFDEKDNLQGKTKQLVFYWRNDASEGTQPPAAIDNIQVKAGADCSLEINKRYTEQNVFLCVGDNTSGMVPGDYVTVLATDPDGCDSTVTLHVKLAEETTIEEPIDVFENALPYVMNGHEYTLSGNYTDSVATDGGCYNLTNFTLNVIPTYNTDFADTTFVSICEGETYEINYFDYAAYNDAVAALEEGEELDPELSFEKTITLDKEATGENAYTIPLKAITGADSVIIVDLTINPTYKIDLGEVHICQGETYDANGFYKNETGRYTLSLQTENGCDSIITLNLVVDPTYNVTKEFSVKSSDKKFIEPENNRLVLDTLPDEMKIDTINGTASTLVASKQYTHIDTLPVQMSLNGCDSIITYNYTVLRSYVDTAHMHDTLCAGEELTLTYFDYPAYNVAVAALEEGEELSEEDMAKFNITKSYAVSTVEDLVMPASNGADSVIKINLVVLGAIAPTTIDTAICFGGVFELDGEEYTEAGTYTTTLQSEDKGCNYDVIYNVTIKDNFVKHEDVVISEGNTYTATWNGGSKELTKEGEYTLYDTKTVHGNCDSIYTVNLTVRTTQRDTIYIAEYCDGTALSSKTTEGFEQTNLAQGDNSWYKYNVTKYATADDQGIIADSIVSVMVIKLNNYNTEEDVTICEGESVDLKTLAQDGDVFVSGTEKITKATVADAGSYTATFTREGCSYTLTLNLTVNPKQTKDFGSAEDPITLCVGETYKENGFNITATAATTAKAGYDTEVKNLKTWQGCDSVVTLYYKVLPLAEKALTATIKEGETFTATTLTNEGATFEGTVPANLTSNLTVSEDGVKTKTPKQYTYTKKYEGGSWLGCDSTVTLTLTVNPVYRDTMIVTSYCDGSQPDAADGFTKAEDGSYYKLVELITMDGKYDSIIYLKQAVNEVYNITEEKTICSAELPYTYKYKNKEVFDAALTKAGTYTKEFKTENGCDSIITLNLVVNDVKTTALPNMVYCQNETDEVVLPEPISQTITPSKLTIGTHEYSKTLKTWKGCDSVVTLNVVINEVVKQPKFIADVCSAPSDPDFTLTETTQDGVKVWTKEVAFTSMSTGCDSIVVMTINQHPTYDSVINDTVQQGVAFAKYNFEVSAEETAVAGTLTRVQNLQTVTYGCDSVVTLKLYVKPAYTEELANATTYTMKMAVGETFQLKKAQTKNAELTSFTFTATEDDVTSLDEEGNVIYKKLVFDTLTYTEGTFTSDSVVVINMEILPAIAPVTLTIEQCQTATGAKAGISGVYTNHRFYTDGDNAAYELCDTVTTTQILINPRYDTIIEKTINNGETFTATDITVKHPVSGEAFTYTLDEAVEVTGEVANNTGVVALDAITRTFTTEKGCEGNVTYKVSVRSTITKSIYDTICANSSSIVPGFEDKTETGVYTLNLKTEKEFDSIVTLNLQVIPNYDVVVEDTLHIYDSKVYYNNTYNYVFDFSASDLTFDETNPQIATYEDVMLNTQTERGCDSVATLNLSVVPFVATQQTIYVCSEEAANNTQLSMERFVTADGIDSIVTYVVEIQPLEKLVVEAEICTGKSYTEYGFNENTTGVYTTTINEDGCDRQVELHLTVTDDPAENIDAVICEGESYVYDAQHVFTTSGTHTFDIDKNGCTTKVNINLTVNPVYNTTNTVTICEGESYDFDGTVCTTSGLYTKTYKSINDCDSVVNVVLVVTPTIETSETATICNGSSYEFHGQTYTTAGTYTAEYKNENGCNVKATLTLKVNAALTETIDATICEGETYTFNGKSYTTAGTYTDTYKNDNGCDVTATLNITVNNKITKNINATICEGSSYAFNNQTLTEAGTYTATFTSVNGCDSVVTLTLVVTDALTETIDATICEGASYAFYGEEYTTAGTYTATYKNNNGCDVVATLNLTVNSVVNETIEATICDGASYTFNNQTLTAAGTYTATLKSVDGCDSVVTLTLSVTDKIYDTVEMSVCEGETYELDGETYTAKVSMSGTYTYTYATAETGCDSVVVVLLTVNPVEKTVETATLEFEGSYEFNGEVYTEPGVYTATLQTVNGCDSVVTLVLQASGIEEVENGLSVSVYPNPTYSDATLSVEGLNEDAQVTVTDIQGRVIYTTVLPQGQTNITIPSSTMAAGYYNVNIIVDNNRVKTTKLLRR